VVCQDPIAKGTEIVINYGSSYLSAEEQYLFLKEGYNFTCTCVFCDTQEFVLDLFRAFICPDKSCTGVVHPLTPRNTSPLGPEHHRWKCSNSTCTYNFTETDSEVFLRSESDYRDDVCQETNNVLHTSHYLVHENMAFVADAMIADGLLENASQIIALRIQNFHHVLSTYHRNKVTEYDKLARVWILCGDVERAKEAYEDAYKICAKCFGLEAEPTLKCKQRSENPPANEEELEKEYGCVQIEDEEEENSEGEDNEGEDEEGTKEEGEGNEEGEKGGDGEEKEEDD